MQHIDHLTKTHRIDRSIGIAIMLLDEFEHPRALPLPRLGRRMLAAELGNPEGVAHFVLHRLRERQKILLGRSNPVERPFAQRQRSGHREYPSLGMESQFAAAPSGNLWA